MRRQADETEDAMNVTEAAATETAEETETVAEDKNVRTKICPVFSSIW